MSLTERTASPGSPPHGTGVAQAVAWMDERLAMAGRTRSGPVTQPRVRPWATVLQAPTDHGPVWLKATSPATAFEVGLYQLLAEVVPDRVLTPLATDRRRGWLLLPDGGPPLGQRLSGTPLTDSFAAALVTYGRLQRDIASHAEAMLGLDVSDMRPSRMLERFDHALQLTAAGALDEHGRAAHRRVAAMRDTVASWCERLAASALPPSLDHNDLHPGNILGSGVEDTRFYDWGDSVVAHPFAAMLVPLGILRRQLGGGLDHDLFTRARDAYLAGFADLAPHEDLVATLDVACRVAKIARALTWDRAVRAARESGQHVREDWAEAPLQTLASILDSSYLDEA